MRIGGHRVWAGGQAVCRSGQTVSRGIVVNRGARHIGHFVFSSGHLVACGTRVTSGTVAHFGQVVILAGHCVLTTGHAVCRG